MEPFELKLHHIGAGLLRPLSPGNADALAAAAPIPISGQALSIPRIDWAVR